MVVIIGGGYAGINLAKALDAKLNVLVIEKKDHFRHHIATLRAVVQPADWCQSVLIPYDQVLKHGMVMQGEVKEIGEKTLTLASGTAVPFDFCVCCTGWKYDSLTNDATGAADATARFRKMGKDLECASSILIIGGGPVGVEMAGELIDVYGSSKKITLVTSGKALIDFPQFKPKFQDKLAKQLESKGVELIFQDKVLGFPDGISPGKSVTTKNGVALTPDIVLSCIGKEPMLPEKHPFQLDAKNEIKIDKTFHAIGAPPNIFAMGDCADTGDPKNAYHCGEQAKYLGKQLVTLADKGFDVNIPAYKNPPNNIMLVPLGKAGGASQLPFGIVGPGMTSTIKGKDLFSGQFWKDMGYKEGMKAGDSEKVRTSLTPKSSSTLSSADRKSVV